MAQPNSFLAEFDSFDTGSWETWLEAALSGDYRLISPERDESIADYVIRIFKSIPLRQKDIFVQVLGRVISCCPYLESYAGRWFALLRIAQVAKPPIAPLLKTSLAAGFGRTPVTVMGTETTLEANLLLTAAKYGVDDWLSDYIWTSSKSILSFDHSLLCMRILSWRLDTSCLKYHRVLIPRLTEHHRAAQYGPECYLVLKRLGCRSVMSWFQTFIASPEQFALDPWQLWNQSFEGALLRFGDDGYAIAMLAELKARSNRFESVMLSTLARVHSDREPDLIPNLMLRIKPILEWEYEDPQELAVPAFAFRHAHEFRSKRFNTPLTPGSPEFEIIDQANLIAIKRNAAYFPYVPTPSSIVH